MKHHLNDYRFYLFQYRMFGELERYEKSSLYHREVLSWLKYIPVVSYLSFKTFPNILHFKSSIIMHAPLYRSVRVVDA